MGHRNSARGRCTEGQLNGSQLSHLTHAETTWSAWVETHPTTSVYDGKKGRSTMERATFGAGCFWGVEQAFRKIDGVVATQVGYAGGTVDNPTYEQVCSHTTGHAEVVEVTYDPDAVSYDELLDVFWHIHNPTTLNRQGPDIGDQYRSVIFYHNDEHKSAAEASRQRLQASGKYNRDIVTYIEPAPRFWRAEEYHQQYFQRRGGGSCHTR